jgi:hypothetical protein
MRANPNRDLPPALRPKEPNVPRLALSAQEMAESLSVSLAHLEKQNLPSCWLGKRRLYPVAQIEQWLAERTVWPTDDGSECQSIG